MNRRPATPMDMSVLSQYVEELCGIVLDDSKAYLVESRLGPLLDEFGIGSYLELANQAKKGFDTHVRERVIDAITTNETSFFRDSRPFDLLSRHLLPKHFSDPNRRQLRIWSAAASTGQEVYSLCILLKELLGDLSRYQIQLLGTDISQSVLQKASYGCYGRVEIMRGLSDQRRVRHFELKGSMWQISDELRSLVRYQKLNLLGQTNGVGIYDMILCRNVAIYFSAQQRVALFERLADHMPTGGILIIGATESLLGATNRFERCEYGGATYYVKR